MALLDSVFNRIFSKQISQQKAIGSDVVASIIEAIGRNNPIYMSDNTATYIKEGYLFNPTVYSVVSLIAQKASLVPWSVYKIKDKKALNLYKSGTSEMTVKRMMLYKSAMEEIENHELNKLFESPNPLQGWAEYIEQVVGYKLVTGNTFIQAIGPENGINKGKVQELWNLPTPLIEILAGDKMNPIKGYRYIPDRDVVIPPEQMIHLKYWTPDYVSGSMLYGQSPIRAGRRVVTKSNASYDASTSSFQNMGILGILSANTKNEGMGLTGEQAQAIEDKLKARASSKSQNKWVATSADLKWQQMGMSPADLAIIESDKMDLRTICNLYHVPSELFNDAANKTYSNTKEAARAIWVNAVIPALTQFRDSFNAFIKGKYEENIYIDFDQSVIPELQDDLQTQVAQLAGAWWLTPNQRLEIMGWDVSTEPLMDVQWIPSGLIPINETGINDATLGKMLKDLGINDYRKGGEGSGNFGHEGRPGLVGGSGDGGTEGKRKIEPQYLENDYDLSEENINDAVYDIQKGLGFRLGKDYRQFDDVVIRVKDHTPEWAYFTDDIENLGVRNVFNATVGNYNDIDFRLGKTTLAEMQLRYPNVRFYDININDGDSINSSIKKISDLVNNR